MESLGNKAKQFRSISEHGIRKAVEPTPLLEETERECDTASDPAVAAWINEVPTLELPAVEIDQLATQVGLRAVPTMFSSRSLQVLDDILIYDQPTWLLP